MTIDPDTSPEAVERLVERMRTAYGGQLYRDCTATLRALSDALEAAEMSAKHWHARAEAAEAERDALKAELAEAVDVLQNIESRPDKMTWGVGVDEDYEVSEAMRDMEEIARAFLARHQKETGV